MNIGLKTFGMAIATVAWSAIVVWVQGLNPATPVFDINFHTLFVAIASAIVPAIVAYFLNPPHKPEPAPEVK